MRTEVPAHQRLKYRPLAEFIGRQLTIPAFDEIGKTLLGEMAPVLSPEFALKSDVQHMANVLAKYGALD